MIKVKISLYIDKYNVYTLHFKKYNLSTIIWNTTNFF